MLLLAQEIEAEKEKERERERERDKEKEKAQKMDEGGTQNGDSGGESAPVADEKKSEAMVDAASNKVGEDVRMEDR